MRWAAPLAALALVALTAPAIGSFHETTGSVPDRVFTLVMSGTSFNGLHAPDTPLLEAFLGERVRFITLATEPHTFHIHGHPWLLANGRIVDTFLVDADQPHAFDVKAGGPDKHAGDWLYHCHINSHVADGMWGVFRVYPYSASILGAGPSMVVQLHRLGEPVEGATLSVTVDGAEVPAHVEPLGHGEYAVHGAMPTTGTLVVTATHPALGTSVARAGLGGTAVLFPPLPVTQHHEVGDA